MHLHHRSGNPANSIMQRHRGMGIGTCIEDNPIVGEAHLMELIYQGTFMVGLVIMQIDLRVSRLEGLKIRLKTRLPIY